MIEPLTIGVAELAARWNLTPRQVLQHAMGLGVPLYFAFDGLAFDFNDKRHQQHGAWAQEQELAALNRAIAGREARLRRQALAQHSPWEGLLTPAEAAEERARIDAETAERATLLDWLDERDAERQRRGNYRGWMRAGPDTLWSIDTTGSAKIPRFAFHPAGQVRMVKQQDRSGPDGEAHGWDGRVMVLEPGMGVDRLYRDMLTIDDLCALPVEVKAIESTGPVRAACPPPHAELPEPGAATAPPAARPQQRQSAQEAAILAALLELGHDPLRLPRAPMGNKPWPLRVAVRERLGPPFTEEVTRKAWKRLRAAGKIKDS